MSEVTSNTGIGQVGTRTYVGGLASKLNTSALIDAAYKQRLAEADRIDVRVETNNTKIEAYNELGDLATNLQTSLKNLSRQYSLLDSGNAFEKRTGTLSSNDGTDPSNLVSISINSGTALGSYQLEIVQKAQAHRVKGADHGDRTTDLGHAGSFTIGLSGGATAAINVSADMSLEEIAAAVNTGTATSGVKASVLKISDTAYQLVLTANTTNKDIVITPTGGDNIMQNLGVVDGGGLFLDIVQPSEEAIVELDGIEVRRDTNSITDLIDGVTIDIRNEAPGTLLDLDITNDTAAVKEAIEGFVESYNEFRQFVLDNQVVSEDGTVSSDAVLFANTSMRFLSLSIGNIFGLTFDVTLDGSPNTAAFRDLGLSFDANNMLSISDESKLDDRLVSNLDMVRQIFETQVTSGSSDMRLVSNKSQTANLSINFDITMSGSAITGVVANGDAAAFDINGTLLIGKEGTAYEGMSFGFIGTSSQTFTVDIKQGIGDLLGNTIYDYFDSTTGTVIDEVSEIEKSNTDLQSEADEIRVRADDFKQRLIDKYALLETKMAAAERLRNQMKAILGISDN